MKKYFLENGITITDYQEEQFNKYKELLKEY